MSKQKIKFKETVVTPKMADGWLSELNAAIESGKFSQRKPSKLAVIRMAADMRRGNFALTHQSIAFNQSGHLIDGRQRLMAICESKMSVRMFVSTGIPDNHHSKSCDIPTMDLIDSGRNRTFGQVLSGIHSVPNGHLIAAILRTVVELTDKESSSITKAQGMELRALIGEEIELIIEAASSGQIERRAPVIGPCVIAATVDRVGAVEFVEKFCLMSNLSATSPMLVLRHWLARGGGSSGKQRRASSLVTSNALCAHLADTSIDSLSPTFDGLEILLKEASATVKKISQIISTT